MKRLAVFLLAVMMLLSSAFAETAAAQNDDSLPEGLWVQLENDWYFQLYSDLFLDAQTAMTFQQMYPGILSEDGVLRANTLVSMEQLYTAVPEIAGVFVPGMQAALSQSAPQTPFADQTASAGSGEEVVIPLDQIFSSGLVQPTQQAAPAEPPIEQFELTGEWFYGDDGKLYYDGGGDYRIMTKDEVFARLNGMEPDPQQEAKKKVYLTFDDAPTKYTMELLAVLDALDVPATFFVVGSYARSMPTFLRAIYDEGHVIGNHSFSHDQDILKSSVSACINDFEKCQRWVNEALGFEHHMTVARVPYGSSTISAASREKLQEMGYLWMDWNALNGDAESGIDSQQEAFDYAIRTSERCDGDVVLLMHDGKKRTIRMLPDLVQYYRDNGYEFAVVSTDITEKIPGVRMGFPTS